MSTTVELQWLGHWWLVYHGCFELVLESLWKPHPMQICDNLGWFSFIILINGILCVLIRVASTRRFLWENTIYHHVKENRKDIFIMPPDPALWLSLISSNYLCLELIFMVPKVFELLKFYCILTVSSANIFHLYCLGIGFGSKLIKTKSCKGNSETKAQCNSGYWQEIYWS